MKVDQAKIRALLIEAVGRASMCWEPKPDGVFDSTEAIITADHYADLILAELAKENPTAPAGLVEELREEMKRNSNATTGAIQCWMVEEILSRYGARKEVEVASDKGLQRICGGSGAWWEYKGKRGRLVFIEEAK